jgi:predicted dehydrogenase
MKTLTRRKFIKGSLAAGITLAVPFSRVHGANERIRVGMIGCGGRGTGSHLPSFENQKGVSVIAVCDADRERMATVAKLVEAKYRHKVEPFVDMRKLIERKDIDVIANATQNYWHGLSTIWACQAGKHVYVEKPLSHYIWEGRQMVNAARKYNRIVQCGTQRRSQEMIAQTIGWIRQGHLGKIKYITAFANKLRRSCGKRSAPLPIPPTTDYELWCGPAQKVPIYRNKLQYDCSFDWNTGDGESCNQGVHELDAARWCLGEAQLPRRVMSMGGRFLFDDACNTPNTQITYYDFATAPVLYEVHNLTQAKDSQEMPSFHGERVGVIVQCEGGVVSLYRGTAWDEKGKPIQSFKDSGDHFANFIEAVRLGQREHLNADILEGHISTAVCHAGNISFRLGRKTSKPEMRTQVQEIPIFAEMYDRLLTHLAAHDINADDGNVTLGPWLRFDPKKEIVLNHKQANPLVRGFYRKGYQIPSLGL